MSIEIFLQNIRIFFCYLKLTNRYRHNNIVLAWIFLAVHLDMQIQPSSYIAALGVSINWISALYLLLLELSSFHIAAALPCRYHDYFLYILFYQCSKPSLFFLRSCYTIHNSFFFLSWYLLFALFYTKF